MIYLIDIDGTTANCESRLHFIKGGKKDWNSFFDQCINDTPIMPVIETVRALKKSEATILAVTGRPDRIRQQTSQWFSQNGVPVDKMYMRKDGDHRPDNIVKCELLDEIAEDFPGHQIIAAFEDRDQVVKAYRERGLQVFQVCDGAY